MKRPQKKGSPSEKSVEIRVSVAKNMFFPISQTLWGKLGICISNYIRGNLSTE
ncbi:MAG: hypothetical protein K9G46_15115 [Flavobacteriales bacterium]|jgi:hypothetical protein|nr:hypothetical protein [Flavobacteriales bacterium]